MPAEASIHGETSKPAEKPAPGETARKEEPSAAIEGEPAESEDSHGDQEKEKDTPEEGSVTETPGAEKDDGSEKTAASSSSNGNGRENQVVHTKSVSIKSAIKGAPREIPVEDKEIDEADVVKKLEPEKEIIITEEDVRKAWSDYAESIKEDKPRIYSTLTQNAPEMTTMGKISIQLNTQAQRQNFVHHIKPALTKYLREHLADIEYVFETNVMENESIGKKVYTDQDKLDYMIRKNRELEKFKGRFNLDFDE